MNAPLRQRNRRDGSRIDVGRHGPARKDGDPQAALHHFNNRFGQLNVRDRTRHYAGGNQYALKNRQLLPGDAVYDEMLFAKILSRDVRAKS